MFTTCSILRRPAGHTLMELVVAMVASAMLVGGLGSVMMIARQVAYTPTAAIGRTEAADVVNQISDELRYATILIQQTPQILEYVVADRNSDGTAEKIRYEWSGTAGAPLGKSINGGTSVVVLDSVASFAVALQLKAKTTSFMTTTDSAETALINSGAVVSGTERTITATDFSAHWLNPYNFPAVPANALYWNLTKVEFYGRASGAATETLVVQIRPTGEPNSSPAATALGQTTVAESAITNSQGWNTATFANAARELAFNKLYDIVWAQTGSGAAVELAVSDTGGICVLESADAGASWQYMAGRQMFCRFYGTYTTPGTTYNVVRNYVSQVGITLQLGSQSNARIDASIPLQNAPELLSQYWRADFDLNPTTSDANGDTAADFGMAGNTTFDPATLAGGIWYANGALETRPLSDFTTTTIVEARCRNTTTGGNGAVVRINADRQGGQYAPLLVCVQRQSDGTQTITLSGKTSDAATKQLFTRQRLSSDHVRFRLTVVPESNVVNLQINGEDQGTFTYPTYPPSSTSDRFLTLYADTSLAEFDYVDVRVATN